MAPKLLDCKTFLITGGAGGLGFAMAEYLVRTAGKQVILVGRTESKLKEASAKLGDGGKHVAHYVLDTGKVHSIAPFAKRVLADHPDLDCVINNAGVMVPNDVNAFDLAAADGEIDINIRGPMHLAIAFLPHLKQRPAGGVLVNLSSVLAFVPFQFKTPVYCATKSWIHYWTTNLRTQLQKSGQADKVRVIEIAPPSVGTDLHRDFDDPDDNKKHKNPNSLTVEEFMEQLVQGWKEDKDFISAGIGKGITPMWFDTLGKKYDELTANK